MYYLHSVVLVTLIATAMCQTLHGRDNSICIPSTAITLLPKPNISEQFHCILELSIVNKNKTVIMEQYFDAVNNRAYLREKGLGITLDAWYDYDTNELIEFFAGLPASTASRCSVQTLSTSNNRILFGYNVTGRGGNLGHIFSASAALHYRGQGINEIYKGRTTVRDIVVDWWQSCQYWDSMDATMIVDWYFTVKDKWDSAFGTQVPVQAHVKGVSYNSGKHYFEHVYNFYNFRPYNGTDDNSVFETPRGVVCPGRKLTKPLPLLPDQIFSMTLEIIDVTGSRMSVMKEIIDWKQKFIMYEYRPTAGDFSPYGTRVLIVIHDFNTGIAYIRDKNLGNCTVQPIEDGTFDGKTAGPHRVRMRTAREFFYFDTTGVSYEGVKLNRRIDCDTWVANRTDWPQSLPTNSTWEWYFATNDWIDLNDGPGGGSVPIQMRVTSPEFNWKYFYNIYNLRKNALDLLKFDISACYEFKQRRKFQIGFKRVSVTAMAQITTNLELLKFSILNSVITATGVSSLRVANIQIQSTWSITTTLELLDVAPSVGDVGIPVKEVPLEFAANTLLAMIHNGQFVVQFEIPGFEKITLVADPNGVVEITYTNATTTTSTSTTPSTPSTTKPPVTSHTVPAPISTSNSSSSPSTASSTVSASRTQQSVSSSATSTTGSLVSSSGSSSRTKTSAASSSTTSNHGASLSSAAVTSTSAQTGSDTTTSERKIKGFGKQSGTDNSTRTLSIVGVVIGSIIMAILAVLLVVYLKKSGRIRVPGQRDSAGFDNVTFSSSAGKVDLQTDD